ncbi:MAG TPA: type II secretion system F family protein [Spirochaetota bacterium]|nr:type II secretion system F family protein [Spirochaetota bacterium]HPJ35403.1 type II secretion system F family protein [Spirochaetota bacterium]
MLYYYRALNSKGEQVSDIVDAPNEFVARQNLRKKGLYVSSISNKKEQLKTGGNIRFKKFLNSIIEKINRNTARKQIGLFSRQLATLLKAGMPLMTALTDIIEQIDNKTFRSVMIDVKQKIEEGYSFSNALMSYRDLFSELYINMIRVGENLGSLDEVIARLAEMEEKNNLLKNRIRAALWYPTFMFTFSVIIVIFLMVNVIPTISEIFTEQNRVLPLPTKIVVGMSDFLSSFWFFLPLFIILIYYMYKRYASTPDGRKKIDELLMKVPLISRLYNKIIVYRFTFNLGVLLSNKVDLLKSFEIVKKIVNNVVVEEKINSASKKVQEGASISQSLKKHEFLPRLVIGMIAAGEASDKVDEMLLNIGNVYENEIDMVVTSLTGMIEPLIIIMMGIIIGIIVLSVMMPIMDMNLMVQ